MAAEVDVVARKILVNMLAAGHTVVASAKAANYSRKHVTDLLREEAFRSEVEAIRQAASRPQTVKQTQVPQRPIPQHHTKQVLQAAAVASVEDEIKEARAFLREVVAGRVDDNDGLLKFRIQAAKTTLAMPGRIMLASQPPPAPVPAPLPDRLQPKNIIPMPVASEEAEKWLEANS